MLRNNRMSRFPSLNRLLDKSVDHLVSRRTLFQSRLRQSSPVSCGLGPSQFGSCRALKVYDRYVGLQRPQIFGSIQQLWRRHTPGDNPGTRLCYTRVFSEMANGDIGNLMDGVGEQIMWSPDPSKKTNIDEFRSHLHRRHPNLSHIGR